jgi:hypothetical protein
MHLSPEGCQFRSLFSLSLLCLHPRPQQTCIPQTATSLCREICDEVQQYMYKSANFVIYKRFSKGFSLILCGFPLAQFSCTTCLYKDDL